jgi:Fur family ferric uptake transcriptional regulator
MAHKHASAQTQFDASLQTLRDHRHRVTEPRKAILEILTSEHGPFTAEELHGRMKKGVCDLVTVYRCLATMEEIALVRRCDFGDGSYRYEFNTGEHHHHHIICRVCHGVQTLDFCVADSLERMARQIGYANVTHTLEIFGVCSQCQRKKVLAAAHAESEED